MSAIPPNLARVPNLLVQQAALSSITRTSLDLLGTQQQLATGRRIGRVSDDAVQASVVLVLDERLEQTGQRLRNMQHAEALLNTTDQALADARDLAQEAAGIASSQVGVGSDATTRANQAVVINSIVQELVSVANRTYTDIRIFGGSQVGTTPIESFLGGYRYRGDGAGLTTDLGPGLDIPVTIGADKALGALSARVEGDVDLNPALTRSTRLQDVRGTRDRGITLGQIEATIDGVTPVNIDLSGAETIGDVLDRIESAIEQAAPGTLNGPFPTSTVAGERLSFSVAAGHTVVFDDIGPGTLAQDLGLEGFTFDPGNPTNTNAGQDLDPRLTDQTVLNDLNPAVPLAYGDIRFRNGPLVGTVTTNATMTIADFKAAVEGLNLGIRVRIGEDGRTIDVVNEVSGLHMSIEEVLGGTAATTLGIRSFSSSTSLDDFNFGRGVEIADGAVDPLSGLPDPQRNADFRVTLQDGNTFDVDLRPQDMADVGTLLARINAEAATAGFGAVFNATLNQDGNGIVFEDSSGPSVGSTAVTSLNGYAAEDLGLLDATYTPGATAVLAGEDRAKVRVDSILSTLLELQTALETNDQTGITLAGERLTGDSDRLLETRALVGARSSRLQAGREREEDVALLNEQIRSSLRDLDYADATTRFSLLQVAQQAGLTATAQSQSLSLLDFLR